MKRFLIFDSPTQYNAPMMTDLLIGDFDRAEDLMVHANWPTTKVPFFSNGMHEVEILDTDNSQWHVVNLLMATDEDKAKAHEALAHITNLHPPVGVRRYMLFGLPRYDGRGGMEDFLHSFDSVKDCVDALRAFVNGSEDELSETWYRLRQANTVYLLDRVLDREQSVRWSEYGAERNIFPNYQDLLQFETKSKPRERTERV